MSSPWLCGPNSVIDAAEAIIADAGIEALRPGSLVISTDSAGIRHASRAGLVGTTWLRAAHRFLALLTSLVDDARAQSDGTVFEEVYAAAQTTLVYPEEYPRSAALLEAVSRRELLNRPLPCKIVDDLHGLDREMIDVMSALSARVWDRTDARAVELLTACIVDLPKRIAAKHRESGVDVLHQYVRAAVRGVLEMGPRPVGPDRVVELRWSPLCHEERVAVPSGEPSGAAKPKPARSGGTRK